MQSSDTALASPTSPTRSRRWFGALGPTLIAAALAIAIVVGVRATLLYEGRRAVLEHAREANHRAARLTAYVVERDLAACMKEQGGDGAGSLARCLAQFDRRVDGGARTTIDIDYLSRLFSGQTGAAQGTVSLLGADGRVLASTDPRRKGAQSSPVKSDDAVSGIASGVASGVVPEGVEADFLYVRQPLDGLPLQIEIRTARREIFADWRDRAFWVAGLTAALGAGCAVLATLLARARRRRNLAEAALQRMASTDALTGLANRRTLDESYDREWRRAQRERVPLSLLFIDVDHFKRFNDRYGHPAGDDALVAVSRAIVGAIRRPGDIAGRYGGEEFMVILPGTDVHGARDVAERIRVAVRAAAIAHEGSQHGHVSVSIGVAGTGAIPSGTPEQLLQAADEALYCAKGSGRDRVTIHANYGGDPCPAI
ncbi:Phytochrome-like protein cph2 [Pandoraea captiosa]|uniref:diguanylate cyclase n=1 Tax=Pandoraea captiosa TaxID=2508302 RepID=A0A5E4ZWR7_9BURK|nr:diguanylate cyclase [Pandoraea captiosa]VVE65436.1 Phytochrome-like protein cph2 [Pandoraea captiosa]